MAFVETCGRRWSAVFLKRSRRNGKVLPLPVGVEGMKSPVILLNLPSKLLTKLIVSTGISILNITFYIDKIGLDLVG